MPPSELLGKPAVDPQAVESDLPASASVVVLWLENDGHAVVEWLQNLVGICRDDGEGLQGLTRFGIAPALPEPGERIW
jgi:hypothetical protein